MARRKEKTFIDNKYWYYNHNSFGHREDVFLRTGTHGVIVPDIRINLKDSSGWRQPSPYSASPISGTALICQMQSEGVEHYGGLTDKHIVGRGSANCGFVGGLKTNSLQDPGCWYLPRLSSVPPRTIAIADNKALLAIANRQGNILETVAELRKTFTGLTKTARSLIAFQSAVSDSFRRKSTKPVQNFFGLNRRHPALRKWSRVLKNTTQVSSLFGQAWLTFWFGLKPIIDDMVLFMRILGDAGLFRIRVKGTGRHVSKTSLSSTFKPIVSPYSMWGNGVLKTTATVEVEEGCYTSLYYKVSEEKIASLVRQATQIGAVDLATVAWALTPMSWLVDFAIPVSQYLRAWEGTHALDFLGGTRTEYRKYEKPLVSYEITDPHPHRLVKLGKAYLSDPIEFRRTVLTKAPNPSLVINDPLDLWQATTTFSLLINRFNSNFMPNVRQR